MRNIGQNCQRRSCTSVLQDAHISQQPIEDAAGGCYLIEGFTFDVEWCHGACIHHCLNGCLQPDSAGTHLDNRVAAQADKEGERGPVKDTGPRLSLSVRRRNEAPCAALREAISKQTTPVGKMMTHTVLTACFVPIGT
jgi:hypothetical protein